MKIVTAKEMQTLDHKTLEDYHIPGLTLMENAGRRVTEEMEKVFGSVRHKKVVVLAGKGHNGGDGLVVARLLMEKEAAVNVFLLSPPQEIRGDAKINLERYEAAGGKPETLSGRTMKTFQKALADTDFVVDALFGTGLSSPVAGTAEEAIKTLHQIQATRGSLAAKVVSVDIPTGIHADTGQVLGMAVQADLTVTFGLPKRGHFLFPGAQHTGTLRIADIGIPESLMAQAEIPVHLLTPQELASQIMPRQHDVHKGSFGHVMVVAGSVGKSGAAVLTSLSALRVGAGRVTLALPKSVEASLHTQPPEIMTLPLPETKEQTLSTKALDLLIQSAMDKTVIAIGPGLSTHSATAELIREALTRITQPIVLDADGLNAFVGHLDRLRPIKGPLVLTPHPGEMGRLTGLGTRGVQQDRLETARSFSREHGVIVVLKGAHTVIATPEGDLFMNVTGNPGMATAGTGDALTGMIAGLIAQRYEVRWAVKLAVYLHGLAGDLAVKTFGPVGILAGDLIDHIPKAMKNLTSNRVSHES
jgi:ADP-dependent NAD(P)H-hydrate dehydratase / NAD(P)H-hydrate epimerase